MERIPYTSAVWAGSPPRPVFPARYPPADAPRPATSDDEDPQESATVNL